MWIKGTIPEGEWSLISQSLQRGQLTGSSRFVDEIGRKLRGRWNFVDKGDRAKQINPVPFHPFNKSSEIKKGGGYDIFI